jgi:phage terminase large subunit
MEITFEPNIKQDLVFDLFDDVETTEIVYGGSAGGGKSYLICSLVIIKALQYPGIRIGLARNELTTLKKTTIVSFFEVANNWGVSNMFQYNSTAGTIKFDNGSEIVLVELSYKPSDPEYTRLGGHLFTFGVVDEVGEVDERGYQIFKSRLGRWKNNELNVKPLCISTCNPVKNWLYREFYRKHVDGVLEQYKKFIQALPTDNPYLPQSYLDNLSKLPFADRERLLFGNWDYEDDPTALLTFEQILNIWDNVPKIDLDKPGKRFITADIAFTSDKLVIIVWDEFIILDIIVNPDGDIEDVIMDLAKKYKVPNYNIAYDSDGVGQFLKKRLTNAKPIINNAKALKDENYKNLKTQLYFKLSDKIIDNSVKSNIKQYKEDMIEELQVIRHKPTNTVGKIEMLDKGEVKRIIGRSPDFSDAMAYRMFFEYKTVGVKTFRIG